MSVNNRGIMAVFVVILVAGCKHSNNTLRLYEREVNRERATGKRFDSLFMGIYMGMTSKQFYMHCWEMNKKGLFTDGNNNSAVLYTLNHGELKHKANMNFYPAFYRDKIDQMGVTFNYDGWAPWNKQLTADSLLADVLHLYKKWYAMGNPFIKIENKERRTIYVKVDGNRRIIIGKPDDMNVRVDYTDLLSERNEK
jgi:hypothetical protein